MAGKWRKNSPNFVRINRKSVSDALCLNMDARNMLFSMAWIDSCEDKLPKNGEVCVKAVSPNSKSVFSCSLVGFFKNNKFVF